MSNKISFPLWLVIIMNLNIMIGAGVFINATSLTMQAGPFGFLSYLTVACILLPLVLVIAQLSKIHKATEGGLYTYSKEGIGDWAGNFSAFAYFFGKSASISVLITAIAKYLYDSFPALNTIPITYSKITFLILILFLNSFGVKIGGKIQIGFMFFKIVPLVLVILLGIIFFNPSLFHFNTINLTDFTGSLSIAMYALIGFEACCLIGHTVASAEKNLSRAVVISFLLVASIDTLFQNSIFGVLGTTLSNGQAPISAFFTKLLENFPLTQLILPKVLNIFVVIAILGAAYGMVYINSWNLFITSKEKTSKLNMLITKLNSQGTPITCLFLQGLIILFCITIKVNITFLSRLAVLGILTSYTLSAISLFIAYKTRRKKIKLPQIITILSLISCFYIGFNCIKDLIATFKNFV